MLTVLIQHHDRVVPHHPIPSAAMFPNKDAKFCALPVELFDHIIHYLEVGTVLKLRLTCKDVEAAVTSRFCGATVAHLGCWIYSKARWERLYNLITASTSLSSQIKTVTFTFDGHELDKHKNFPNYCGIIPRRLNRQSHDKRFGEMVCYDRGNEEAGFKEQGVAEYMLMVQVLRRIKAHGCLLRLNLSPGNPRATRITRTISHIRQVHSDLQRAIADIQAPIEGISIDRLRHRDLEDVLQGHSHEFAEIFGSLRDIELTPVQNDGFNTRKSRRRRWDLITAMFTHAQHLRKVYVHTTTEYRKPGERTRAQQWTASLLHANGLAELQSLVLVGVPVRVKDLETVLVRCSCTLENLELDDLIPGGGSQQAWLRILEQLATMERLCTLKLVLSDRIFPDLHAAKALTTFGFERQIQRYGKGHFYTLSLPDRRELLEGLTKLLESDFGRGPSRPEVDDDTDLEDEYHQA